MQRLIFRAMVPISSLAAILIAAPACRAHCGIEHDDASLMLGVAESDDPSFDWRAQFQIQQVQNRLGPDNRGNRQLGAHSDGLGSLGSGSLGGGSLGTSVDHGIGVMPDSGIGTYRGGGLGALGSGEGGPATGAIRVGPNRIERPDDREDPAR